MSRLSVRIICPNCSKDNYIDKAELLIKNQCHSCSSTLDDVISTYDSDAIIKKFIPQYNPINPIPKRCGYCEEYETDYTYQDSSIKGYCHLYKIDTFNDSLCIVTEIIKEVDKTKQITKECPKCGKPQNIDANYCKDCGTPIFGEKSITIAYCDKCESEYDESYQFCEKDGNKLVLKKKEISDSPRSPKSEGTNEGILEDFEPLYKKKSNIFTPSLVVGVLTYYITNKIIYGDKFGWWGVFAGVIASLTVKIILDSFSARDKFGRD